MNAYDLPTSVFLRATLKTAIERIKAGEARRVFLCICAPSMSRMTSILLRHGIYLDGTWHKEVMALELDALGDNAEARYFLNWIRFLFLTLAIRHYESIGD